MRIVIDDKIPYIREAVAAITSDAVYLDGRSISAADVRDADALIVRTRTRCDERLLGGSRVRFIATATIGYDHLDTAWLDRAGIAWTNCPGCNANSVSQYVRTSLLSMARDFGLSFPELTLGVVGCGQVGSRVLMMATALGLQTIACDPPQEAPWFVSMERIVNESDIITFHVPLTDEGRWPTRYLADAGFFSSLRRRPFIINTSRGGVVNERELLAAMRSGQVRQAVVDTWENEPDINRELLEQVYIGTPHIAGYSADGKVNADNMALNALCRFFHLPPPPTIVPPPMPEGFVYTGDPLQLYDPLADSRRLKADPQLFEHLRGHYPLRRESMRVNRR